MTATIFGIFDFRIAVDDSWMMAKVAFFIFLGMTLLAFVGVCFARRRERLIGKSMLPGPSIPYNPNEIG
jgi:hypothetical protein